MIKNAVQWALTQLEEGQTPDQHGFVDLVRQYLEKHGVDHPPMCFEDVKPFLS
jgi:hypothetical protein